MADRIEKLLVDQWKDVGPDGPRVGEILQVARTGEVMKIIAISADKRELLVRVADGGAEEDENA